MPCDNVTELMRIVIGRDERLKSYRFLKKTCGGAVGTESLLLDQFKGRTADQLLALRADIFASGSGQTTDIEEFLNLKHFFAIKAVLEAFTGNGVEGGADSACTIAGISHDGDNTIIDAEIAVGIVTEMIKSCGHCGGG